MWNLTVGISTRRSNGRTRSKTEIDRIIEVLPDTWKNDKETRSDVMFLWEEIDDASLLEKMKIRSGVDTVKYTPGAILWFVEKENLSKSGLSKIVGTEMYKKMTIRNVNTVRKIHALMRAGDS